MTERFNLIKTEGTLPEKRILPRYPFNFMTFKSSSNTDHAFEVADISTGGMRLALKDGGHTYRPGDNATGELHWKKFKLSVVGKVAWTQAQGLGIEFSESIAKDVSEMLDIDNVLQSLKPIHRSAVNMNIPNNLKYWLRTDGPVELFFWTHSQGDFEKVQFCVFDKYFEWEDGQGIKTGSIVERKNIDSPLTQEDEFIISFDESINSDTVAQVFNICEKLPEGLLSKDAINFIMRKTQLNASAS